MGKMSKVCRQRKKCFFLFQAEKQIQVRNVQVGFYKNKPEHIISALHALFYRAKEEELQRKISFAKSSLKSINAQQLLNDMQAKSMQYFKHRLYIKYSKMKVVRFSPKKIFGKGLVNFNLNIRWYSALHFHPETVCTARLNLIMQ